MLDSKVLALVYFSRAQAQVSSTLRGLTSVFEMGTGVTLSLEAPRLYYLAIRILTKILNRTFKVRLWENLMEY